MKAPKFHTVIFVPHARARYRKFQVSDRLLKIGAIAVSASIVIAVVSVAGFLSGLRNTTESNRLKEENRRLQEANRRYSETVDQLKQKLDGFENKIGKLAILAGMTDSRELGRGGTGGPAEPTAAEGLGRLFERGLGTSVGEISDRSLGLGHDLDQLEAKLRQRQSLLDSMPSIAPTTGIPTSGFGGRIDPFDGRHEFHHALDISASVGSPVVAPAAGIVTEAGWENGYGRVIRLSHGFGVMTIYGHLSSIAVRPGMQVERGQVIGRVGSTGRSTGPHLHYEVRVDGRPETPLKYILDAF